MKTQQMKVIKGDLEIEFTDLILTDDERKMVADQYCYDKQLSLCKEIHSSEDAAEEFESLMSHLSDKEKNKSVVLLMKGLQKTRETKKNYIKGIISDAESQKMDIEDIDTDLLKAVKRAWL